MSFARNISNKYWKKILDTAAKTRQDEGKSASKEVVYKITKAKGELIRDENTQKIVKRKPVIDENSRNVEKIIISPEKREKVLNELIQGLKNRTLKNN